MSTITVHDVTQTLLNPISSPMLEWIKLPNKFVLSFWFHFLQNLILYFLSYSWFDLSLWLVLLTFMNFTLKSRQKTQFFKHKDMKILRYLKRVSMNTNVLNITKIKKVEFKENPKHHDAWNKCGNFLIPRYNRTPFNDQLNEWSAPFTVLVWGD